LALKSGGGVRKWFKPLENLKPFFIINSLFFVDYFFFRMHKY